jgi:hypothetical protein
MIKQENITYSHQPNAAIRKVVLSTSCCNQKIKLKIPRLSADDINFINLIKKEKTKLQSSCNCKPIDYNDQPIHTPTGDERKHLILLNLAPDLEKYEGRIDCLPQVLKRYDLYKGLSIELAKQILIKSYDYHSDTINGKALAIASMGINWNQGE